MKHIKQTLCKFITDLFNEIYIYNSKFNNVPVNKSTFADSYRQFNLVMVEMKLKHLGKATEVNLLLNKELGI